MSLGPVEQEIIDAKLANQKIEILDRVDDHFQTLTDLVLESKSMAEKTYYAIEGNGAIGIKEQVKECRIDIEEIKNNLDANEKKRLENKIQKYEKVGNRRKEDKTKNRTTNIAFLGIVLTIIGNIVITLIRLGVNP